MEEKYSLLGENKAFRVKNIHQYIGKIKGTECGPLDIYLESLSVNESSEISCELSVEVLQRGDVLEYHITNLSIPYSGNSDELSNRLTKIMEGIATKDNMENFVRHYYEAVRTADCIRDLSEYNHGFKVVSAEEVGSRCYRIDNRGNRR